MSAESRIAADLDIPEGLDSLRPRRADRPLSTVPPRAQANRSAQHPRGPLTRTLCDF